MLSFFPCCCPNLAQVLWMRSRSSQRPPVLPRISSLLPHCVEVSKNKLHIHVFVFLVLTISSFQENGPTGVDICVKVELKGRPREGSQEPLHLPLAEWSNTVRVSLYGCTWNTITDSPCTGLTEIYRERINGRWIKEKRKENAKWLPLLSQNTLCLALFCVLSSCF